jgi:hypothetical protein
MHRNIWFQSLLTKAAWYWHKSRHADQCNRRFRNKPVQLQLTKEPKHTLEKKPLQQTCRGNWASTRRKQRLEPIGLPCTKTISKWIGDFKSWNLTRPGENMSRWGNGVLNRAPIVQEIRASIDQWYCIKSKSYCTAKETNPKAKRQLQNERKIFVSHSYDGD